MTANRKFDGGGLKNLVKVYLISLRSFICVFEKLHPSMKLNFNKLGSCGSTSVETIRLRVIAREVVRDRIKKRLHIVIRFTQGRNNNTQKIATVPEDMVGLSVPSKKIFKCANV